MIHSKDTQEEKLKDRLISLDVFRGLTIIGMILVNKPGGTRFQSVYPPLTHADWHGLTPADLVFPFFLFIVGVAIKFSLDKYLASNVSVSKIILRITRRVITLFVLGLLLKFPNYNLATIRIPGVLQRIAICYFFSSILYLIFAKKKRGFISISIIVVLLITGYYFIMMFIPVPGYGSGMLDSKEGNLAAHIDRMILGRHMAKPFDPDGILTTIPAIATTLTGLLCAWMLKSKNNGARKLIMMFIAGNSCIILGYLFHLALFPINKNLWSSSFVLVTAGAALNLLGMCYWYTDTKGYRFGTKPFLIFGTNPITAYFLSGMMHRLLIFIKVDIEGKVMSIQDFSFEYIHSMFFSDFLGSFMYGMSYVLLWLLLIGILYQKKIFIKV